MGTRLLAVPLLAVLALWAAPRGAAQVPVKLFTANDGQKDKGTSQLVAAVRKHLAEMPKYKLWEGRPSEFPKNGVVLDIQGMDVIDSDGDVIGSAVLLMCSEPSPHDPGYYNALHRTMLEVQAGDQEEIDSEAADFLKEMDRRVPASKAEAAEKPAKKPEAVKKATAGKKSAPTKKATPAKKKPVPARKPQDQASPKPKSS